MWSFCHLWMTYFYVSVVTCWPLYYWRRRHGWIIYDEIYFLCVLETATPRLMLLASSQTSCSIICDGRWRNKRMKQTQSLATNLYHIMVKWRWKVSVINTATIIIIFSQYFEGGKQLTDFFFSISSEIKALLFFLYTYLDFCQPASDISVLLTCDQNTFCNFMMLFRVSHSALYLMNTKYLFTKLYYKIVFGTYCLWLKITFSSLVCF